MEWTIPWAVIEAASLVKDVRLAVKDPRRGQQRIIQDVAPGNVLKIQSAIVLSDGVKY